MPKLKVTLINNIKRLLYEHQISQSDLAKEIGVTVQAISMLMNGRAGLSSSMIAKISEFFEIEETDLVSVPSTSPERVELSKEQWELFSQTVKSAHSSIPQDIQDAFERMDEADRKKAITLFRIAMRLQKPTTTEKKKRA